MIRRGSYGLFIACSKFPRCKGKMKYDPSNGRKRNELELELKRVGKKIVV